MALVVKTLLSQLPTQFIQHSANQLASAVSSILPQRWMAARAAAATSSLALHRPTSSSLVASSAHPRPSSPSTATPQPSDHLSSSAADDDDKKKNKKQQEQHEVERRQRHWWFWNQAYSHQRTQSILHQQQQQKEPQQERFHKTRLPIVMCHGLFGFDKIGPETVPMLQMHYWGGIAEALRAQGANVYIAKVPSVGSIEERAMHLHKYLASHVPGQDVNLVCHSMGGLDARFLITHMPSRLYTIRSLTTISTPHRGSPLMDWFRDTIGIGAAAGHKGSSGRLASSSLLARLLAPLDAPAYSNLTTDYLTQTFNPSTPNNPNVKYYSYGANATAHVGPLSPIRFSWDIVRAKEGENDGIVSVHSSKWGEYVETLNADHFDLNKQRRILVDFRKFVALYEKTVNISWPAGISLHPRQLRTQYYGLQGALAAAEGSSQLSSSTGNAAVDAYRRRLTEIMNNMYGPEAFDDFIYGYDAAEQPEEPAKRSVSTPSRLTQQQRTEFDAVQFYLLNMDRLYRQGF